MGAVLQQDVTGSWAPLAFYSKKLSSAESRYSAIDRELFAAYSALRHFRFLLEGKEFVLFTDHKPLTQALFRPSPPWSAMQQRRLSFISWFNCDIRHLSGECNVVADALSCPVSPSSSPSPELNQSSFSPSLIKLTSFRILNQTHSTVLIILLLLVSSSLRCRRNRRYQILRCVLYHCLQCPLLQQCLGYHFWKWQNYNSHVQKFRSSVSPPLCKLSPFLYPCLINCCVMFLQESTVHWFLRE